MGYSAGAGDALLLHHDRYHHLAAKGLPPGKLGRLTSGGTSSKKAGSTHKRRDSLQVSWVNSQEQGLPPPLSKNSAKENCGSRGLAL